MTTSNIKHSAFTAIRLTSSTFLIKEFDDIYSEHPHIYAIIVPVSNLVTNSASKPGTIILIDTGCGGASNDPKTRITNLREFIETVNVPDNDRRPLNGLDMTGRAKMDYIVVLTHCHYDHIRKLHSVFYSDSPIFASSHCPEFLSNIPEHSLCNFLDIHTPKYTPSVVSHGHIISNLITILHTPGHTPDSLTIYDSTSNPPMLYVGDTLYEYEPIMFPSEGSIVDWFRSIEALIEFVETQERSGSEEEEPLKFKDEKHQQRVLLNAGHVTYLQPALTVLRAVMAFMEDVVSGREPVRRRWVKRGEETVEYRQSQSLAKYSLICPERLIFDVAQSRR
ncbi:Metallo-hydrolase/oxidoreductase [Lentinula aciculospora]|uniref:Metallo-hydrolase/oxidoreductase n=1 Tax=Lentinula aciculospora TaxID=153920 RepID=A0A9W9A9V1_9AGAR|nr:Metallo-hydrolase/oxidoreductase [Lentinula aciculospora]